MRVAVYVSGEFGHLGGVTLAMTRGAGWGAGRYFFRKEVAKKLLDGGVQGGFNGWGLGKN